MARRSERERKRDYFIYVGIAVAVVGISLALGVYSARTGGRSSPFLLNWVGLGGVMSIVYGTAIFQNRVNWKNTRFWSGVAIAAVLEIGIGMLALRGAPRITTWFWAFLVLPANTIAVGEFLRRWLGGPEGGEAA